VPKSKVYGSVPRVAERTDRRRRPVSVLRLRPGAVEWRSVEGEVLALDVDAATYIAANESGTVLWERLAEGATRDQLVDALLEAYEIERPQAEMDVEAFVAELRSRGLLEETGE
jgi:hypothetical protein